MTIIEQALASRATVAEAAWAKLLDLMHGRADATPTAALKLLDQLGLPSRTVAEMADAVTRATAMHAAGGDVAAAVANAHAAAVVVLEWELETERLVDKLRASRADQADALDAAAVDADRRQQQAFELDDAYRPFKVRFPFLFSDVFPPPVTAASRAWYADEAKRLVPLDPMYDGPRMTIDTPAGVDPQFYRQAVAAVAEAFPMTPEAP